MYQYLIQNFNTASGKIYPAETESIASVVCTTSSEVSRLKSLSISTGEKVLLFRKKRNSQSNNRKKRYKENHKINFLTLKTKKNLMRH